MTLLILLLGKCVKAHFSNLACHDLGLSKLLFSIKGQNAPEIDIECGTIKRPNFFTVSSTIYDAFCFTEPFDSYAELDLTRTRQMRTYFSFSFFFVQSRALRSVHFISLAITDAQSSRAVTLHHRFAHIHQLKSIGCFVVLRVVVLRCMF